MSRAEPCEHLLRVPVGWKDGIEDLDDAAVLGDQRQPLVQRQPFDLERRETWITRQIEPFVADDRERHLVPLRELDLVGEALRADAGDADAELTVEIPEPTRLRRAAACAGKVVPPRQ